jgi:hypothetical protein
MNYRNRVPPSEQRRLLLEQIRTWQHLDRLTKSQTVEALARPRELLAVPVYRSPKLTKDA